MKEPEFIGDCFWIKHPDSIIVLEKQEYSRKRMKPSVLLVNRENRSLLKIPLDSEVIFMVRVANNLLSPLQQIYIFQLESNKHFKKVSFTESGPG